MEAVCDFGSALVVTHGVGDPLAERTDLEEKIIHRSHEIPSYHTKHIVL